MKLIVQIGSKPSKRPSSTDKLLISKIIAELANEKKEEIDALIFSQKQEEELLKLLSK
ncbi:hypothetical protein [Leptospira sarikeiensis]|uniref:hypothetical protein n=1 Tax=Leptospira sarikeiensis TaxID=2484943 RepID=UPI0014383920|nr:hypothetical protein [Leptospira sarikeiensis]